MEPEGSAIDFVTRHELNQGMSAILLLNAQNLKPNPFWRGSLVKLKRARPG